MEWAFLCEYQGLKRGNRFSPFCLCISIILLHLQI
nr:MAG TPA: hypothetical protein [Caudoviricetes sp.]